jgi:hypothetical protein
MGFIPRTPEFCHPRKNNFGMLIALLNSSLTPHRESCVLGMEFLHRFNLKMKAKVPCQPGEEGYELILMPGGAKMI